MVLKPCAAEKTTEGEPSKFDESIESMEAASSVFLKPCAAETTTERDSSKFEEKAEPMEVSSVIVDLCPTKRKAEFDLEEEEEEEEEEDYEEEEKSAGEIEKRIAKAKIEQRESEKALLVEPEWDVDSFDGLEYYSSPESDLSSDEQPYSDMEEPREHYRLYKRTLIESKGFYADSKLRPSYTYKGIFQEKLDREGVNGRTYRDTCEEMVYVCLQKHNQDKDSNVEFVELVRANYRGGPRPKSYITFMAREKPDGPLVEYQAKGMRTLDGKKHPIICRPAPPPKH